MVHLDQLLEVVVLSVSFLELQDCGSSGYVLNTILYTGSETLPGDTNDFPHLPQPAQVVMHLAVPYLDSGWRMLTDRYYTSVPLVQALIHQHLQ